MTCWCSGMSAGLTCSILQLLLIAEVVFELKVVVVVEEVVDCHLEDCHWADLLLAGLLLLMDYLLVLRFRWAHCPLD